MTDRDDEMLERLFRDARQEAPVPSDALLARVLADAAEVGFSPVVQAVALPRRGRAAAAFELMGGWLAAGGLAASLVAGLWVGVAPPSSVEPLTASIFGSGTYDLGSEIDSFMTEVSLDG